MFIASLLVCVLASSLVIAQAWGQNRMTRRDRIRSTLKNAATAEESYATSAGGRYTRVLDDLKEEGFEPSPNVNLLIPRAGESNYCLEAQHEAMGEIWHYSSRVGTPERGRC
jgi:hypothetical protein